MTPVWFLDVDGVLNAVRHVSGDDDYRRLLVPGPWQRSWPIVHSPAVVERVVGMARSGAADVTWLTTWMGYARQYLAPALGLPDLPVLGEEELSAAESSDPLSWWKARAVVRYLDEHPAVPYVWTDDDLDDATSRAVRERCPGHESLQLAPEPVTGLTAGDLDDIGEFLTAHAPER